MRARQTRLIIVNLNIRSDVDGGSVSTRRESHFRRWATRRDLCCVIAFRNGLANETEIFSRKLKRMYIYCIDLNVFIVTTIPRFFNSITGDHYFLNVMLLIKIIFYKHIKSILAISPSTHFIYYRNE